MTEDWSQHADDAAGFEGADEPQDGGHDGAYDGAYDGVYDEVSQDLADEPDLPVDGEPSLDAGGHVRTGNVTVDAVLASMEGLDDAPVNEHVAVFEHAHEQLRAALDGAGEAAEAPAEHADGS